MPELPEVEVLARHMDRVLRGRTVREVSVLRTKSTQPTSARRIREALTGGRFLSVRRRAKYLLFEIDPAGNAPVFTLLGHLGMTGRMYLLPARRRLPRHAVVTMDLGRHQFVFEDTRYFGRLTLDDSALAALGPEPLEVDFDGDVLRARLGRSRQAIKVKLLDQRVVGGIGNIYASEALFRAGISPRQTARRLSRAKCRALVHAIRATLQEAIEGGSTVPLDFSGASRRDGLFYYGRAEEAPDYYEEQLAVYDREGEPCLKCATPIRRMVQAARSTYFCPACQRA